MFLKLFCRHKKTPEIQTEYIGLLKTAMTSPLWDGSDEQLYHSFPKDLTAETIAYVRNELGKKEE